MRLQNSGQRFSDSELFGVMEYKQNSLYGDGDLRERASESWKKSRIDLSMERMGTRWKILS